VSPSPDDRVRWHYPPEFCEALLGFGLVARETAPPVLLRDAVNDLYRVELRRLRAALLAGRVVKTAYHGEVVALRRKYWILTLNLQVWERICKEGERG